jgi:hypothetical protein
MQKEYAIADVDLVVRGYGFSPSGREHGRRLYANGTGRKVRVQEKSGRVQQSHLYITAQELGVQATEIFAKLRELHEPRQAKRAPLPAVPAKAPAQQPADAPAPAYGTFVIYDDHGMILEGRCKLEHQAAFRQHNWYVERKKNRNGKIEYERVRGTIDNENMSSARFAALLDRVFDGSQDFRARPAREDWTDVREYVVRHYGRPTPRTKRRASQYTAPPPAAPPAEPAPAEPAPAEPAPHQGESFTIEPVTGFAAIVTRNGMRVVLSTWPSIEQARDAIADYLTAPGR